MDDEELKALRQLETILDIKILDDNKALTETGILILLMVGMSIAHTVFRSLLKLEQLEDK